MNFEFSDEQNLLREQAHGFLRDNCPPAAVRKILEGKQSFDEKLWRQIGEMGWTATTIPEQHGGLGLGYLELCVIAEELGRAAAPVPFSSSVYLATEALLLAGNAEQQERWLPRLAAGEAIGTFAMAEGPGRPSPKALKTTLSKGRLRGTKLAVPDGDTANFAVVVAKTRVGDKASWFLVDLDQRNVKRTPVSTLDPTRSHASLTFRSADAELLGAEGEGWALTQKLLDRAAILFAWEQIGGAEAALDMAKEYALGRYAFGRPIASYQAIKHKLAGVYIRNTLARSNGYFGAWALNSNASELSVAAASARVAAIQAYYLASKENIQTHGGMGFTWEFDCQFYYRRAKLLSVNIGSEGFWQDRLITAIEHSNAA